MVVAEIEVLEVLGKLDETSTIMETMDVNGFQLFPSQKSSSSSMEEQNIKKITWTIKNFLSLSCTHTYSDEFVSGGCKWRLLAFPKRYANYYYAYVYLVVVDHASLPSGWRRHVRYLSTIVNQNPERNLITSKHLQHWFDEKSLHWGYVTVKPIKYINAQDDGFLVNGEFKIVAEVDVLEVIGKLDVTKETETKDVNGFQLLPSQAKSVSRMFERHPEIASEFLPKNPTLRTGYMSFLLSLVETMCQSPHELSKDDLSSASAALECMKKAGFELDWLEKKLDEVSEKKEYEEAIENGLQGMEEELKKLKLRCSDMEAFVEKEKKKVLSAKAPLSFDDVV